MASPRPTALISMSSGKRLKWGSSHDELFLREFLNSEIWLTKISRSERGEKSTKIAEALNAIEMPKFDVSQRSTRERFQFLFERRKAKNREDERASCISPEISDIDKLLDELIELFQTANLERENSAKKSANRAALGAERGLDMRRMSMETMGESSKRQASDTDRGREKRSRRVLKDTFEYLNEKLTLDIEWQRKDFELKERVLEEKVKSREYKEEERDWYREHVERRFDSMCNHLEKQNEMLLQMSRHLEEQRTLLLTVFGTSEE